MLDMVLTKQFTRNVHLKGSQNMGVKCRLLVIGMVFWVCDFVYPPEVSLTTLMAIHDDNKYISSQGTHRCEGLLYHAPRCMMSRHVFIYVGSILDSLGLVTLTRLSAMVVGWMQTLRALAMVVG